MSVVALEGIVEHGRIRLITNVCLPDKAKVYVIVPGGEVEQASRIFSPRLAHPEQAADFQMEIVAEQGSDAGV